MKPAKDTTVEQWGVFEIALKGPHEGNPYKDIQLSARFEQGTSIAEADGFYDGEGTYRIRFIPGTEGAWSYETASNCAELNGIKGVFVCTPPAPGNHGPVRVKDPVHFAYADETGYTPIGTNCYAWHLQSVERQEETLRTLKQSPFNKLRMCVFPRSDALHEAGPDMYPFEGSPEHGFDYSRFRPDYFAHLEQRVADLAALGIQAELILFHPYDEGRWGFDSMTAEEDDRYVRYCVARLGAFHNVWWSLANDYDVMTHKSLEDWSRLLKLVQEYDYGQHLRSIHHHRTWYDFGEPWITHSSIRHSEVRVASDCTRQYGKPAVIDECGCEGNLDDPWGSLTPEEMLCRIWEGHCRGGYVTHGETYLNDQDGLWQLQGGKLHGESADRIAFLRHILEEAPPGLIYSSGRLDAATLEVRGEYYLQYFGPHRFAFREFELPEGRYQADIIDTWNMTITPYGETLEGRFRIHLPAKLYYALRITKIG
jgi:hypothetical protein